MLERKLHTQEGTTLRDLAAAGGSLETTYLVRLWAEFETALLSYYRFLRSNPQCRLRAIDMVNYLAGVRRGRAIAEAVRDADPAMPVDLVESRRRLNTFLGKLPEH
jgi:hypothetical protein